MPHDWSFVVWAEREPVTIRHAEKIISDSFYYVGSNESIEVPSNFEDRVEKDFKDLNNYELAQILNFFNQIDAWQRKNDKDSQA